MFATMPCGVEEGAEVFVEQYVDVLTFLGVCHGARNLSFRSYKTIEFVEVTLECRFELLAVRTNREVNITIDDFFLRLFHESLELDVALRLSDECLELFHFFLADGASVPRRCFGSSAPYYSAVATHLRVNTTIVDKFV